MLLLLRRSGAPDPPDHPPRLQLLIEVRLLPQRVVRIHLRRRWNGRSREDKKTRSSEQKATRGGFGGGFVSKQGCAKEGVEGRVAAPPSS